MNQTIWLVIWIAVVLLGVVVETLGPQLISIWFAVAGLGAVIANLCGLSGTVQFVLFVVLAVLLVIFTRPLARKLKAKEENSRTNVDALAGQTCVVTEEIDNLQAKGACKVGGQSWTARAENGEVIPEGHVVRIVRVEGVKLIVTE